MKNKKNLEEDGTYAIQKLMENGLSEKEIERFLSVETCHTAFNMLSAEKKLEYILSSKQLWDNYEKITGIDRSPKAILNRNGVSSEKILMTAKQKRKFNNE